ncbi:MFS transporter [Asticcacaulis sp. W401b]|uniref:MFS transporter n=1 Tax=Asticcacaulis sp. W401b TaxID=3388666 RepID=UPI003970B1FD
MQAPSGSNAPAGATRYRWLVVTLLFTAMVINYVDRQTVSLLKPTLQAEFGWSELDYADLVFWFQFAYALSYLAFGKIVDRFGARIGFSLAFVIWQAAHIGHAAMSSLKDAIIARVFLGIGEGGAFPGGVKAVSEWFPKSERAFAVGLFNAGTNIGAIVTPLVIPAITLTFGWQAAFIFTGAIGLLWLPVWWLVYRRPREHKKVNALELSHIEQDPVVVVEKVSWLKVIRARETWGYALGKFLIDPIWWMFLFWLPDFLHKRYGLDLKTFGPPLVAIYLLSDIGSVGGGWLSSQFIKRGWSVNAARKVTMLICAALALPVGVAAMADNLWVAVAIIGVATAAHQGFSANLYTLPSDVFPNGAVGSVVGIGGMFGAFGGMAMAKYAGFVLDKIGSYTPIFVYAATGYFLALLAVHLLMPKLESAKIG